MFNEWFQSSVVGSCLASVRRELQSCPPRSCFILNFYVTWFPATQKSGSRNQTQMVVIDKRSSRKGQPFPESRLRNCIPLNNYYHGMEGNRNGPEWFLCVTSLTQFHRRDVLKKSSMPSRNIKSKTCFVFFPDRGYDIPQ